MHVAFRVPDVAAAREELEAKGVEFTDETYESGACHMALLAYPDGNELMPRRPYAPYE
jgi:hypothetical protein